MTHAPDSGRLVLVRHGQTQWSAAGRHTGRTDLPLTEKGERDAAALADPLRAFESALVLASPLERARRTAELAGLSPQTDPDLLEWDYGAYEGLTTAQIRKSLGDPQWTVFRGVIPAGATPGETVEEVSARASWVLQRVDAELSHRDVVLVAHGHLLRVLAATFLHEQPRFAARLLLSAGAMSVLRHDKDGPAIETWNVPPGAS